MDHVGPVDEKKLSKLVSDIELFDAGEKILPEFEEILKEIRSYYLGKRAVDQLRSTLDDEYMPSHLLETSPSKDALTRDVQEHFASCAVTACIKHGARPFAVTDYVALGRLCNCQYLGWQTSPEIAPLSDQCPETFFHSTAVWKKLPGCTVGDSVGETFMMSMYTMRMIRQQDVPTLHTLEQRRAEIIQSTGAEPSPDEMAALFI